MADLKFTDNQVYVGTLAQLKDYDAVKYDRNSLTLSFYDNGKSVVVFKDINANQWKAFEAHFKTKNLFDHKTQWAWFKQSAIKSTDNSAPHIQVTVNFDSVTYSLKS